VRATRADEKQERVPAGVGHKGSVLMGGESDLRVTIRVASLSFWGSPITSLQPGPLKTEWIPRLSRFRAVLGE
jgi:hypothetical protein